MIQYSPYIEGTIPAFINNIIKVPFEMNPAVGKAEVKGFALMVKDMGSPEPKFYVSQIDAAQVEYALENRIVNFNISDLQEGQYYKIQIAYMSKTNEDLSSLAYSSVAVGRCVSTPTIYIKDLDFSINEHRNYYTGIYETPDISEPVYTHHFTIVQQNNGAIIDDSGDLLNNSFYDKIENDKRICNIKWFSNTLLEDNLLYYINYTITTINGYQTTTRYQLRSINKTEKLSGISLSVENCREDGYIKLKVYSETEADTSKFIGNYVIYRKSSLSNYKVLDKIIEFSISGQTADKDWDNYEWRDMSIEQGLEYSYVLYSFKINSTTKTMVHNAHTDDQNITAQFEDLFLGDNKKQMAVKFNPKVSSFKETVQETKVETIGSKYPYFFRNGNVAYKEIPISGLISYLADENELFMKQEELGLNDTNTPTTNLVDYNITAERKFRAAALEWLNNGQPKLFRSPTEGNFIIRLMNVSLSPNDTLGRLIYTFSATGYEIAECNYKNLSDMGLVNCVIEGKKTGRQQ